MEINRSTVDQPSILQSLLQSLWIPSTPCSDSIEQLHGMLPACPTHCLTSPTNNALNQLLQRKSPSAMHFVVVRLLSIGVTETHVPGTLATYVTSS